MSLSTTAVDCSVSPAWQSRDQSQAALSSLDCGFLDCQINRCSWCYLEEPTYVGNEEETLLDRMSSRYGFSSLISVRKYATLRVYRPDARVWCQKCTFVIQRIAGGVSRVL